MKPKRSLPLENSRPLREEFKKVYESKNVNMSKGAQNFVEAYPKDHKDEWRGRFKKNHKKAL